jgi:hypothetical protein
MPFLGMAKVGAGCNVLKIKGHFYKVKVMAWNVFNFNIVLKS